MPAKKTKTSRKKKPAKKVKPEKFDLAEYRRQHPPYVVVDTGVERLSQETKEKIVYRDNVESLLSGTDSPAQAHPDSAADLDRAAEAILFRQMLQKKSKKEIAQLNKAERLHRDLDHLALAAPDEATEVILYSLLRLPQESLLRVRDGARRCLEELRRARAKRGRGKPKGHETPTVLSRWVEVAILKHVRGLTWSQIARHFGMPPIESNWTLMRQRDKYARLIYQKLRYCGADLDGKNLDACLSPDYFARTQVEIALRDCGLDVHRHPATCRKLARELFVWAARRVDKPSTRAG